METPAGLRSSSRPQTFSRGSCRYTMTIAPWTNGFPVGAAMTDETWAAAPCGSSGPGLHQLEQYSPGGAGMDEGDSPSPSPDPRRRLDHRGALPPQLGQRCLDVGHAQAEMVEPLAAPAEEPRDGGFGAQRLEQLETSLTRRQERDTDALRGDLFDSLHRQTQRVAIEGERRLQRLHRDTQMIDDHAGPPSFSINRSTAVYGSIVRSASDSTNPSKTPPMADPAAHSRTRSRSRSIRRFRPRSRRLA